uniref:Uncharacterized protein n=1 Tax=Solanum tuberosum TaxID=4113 RepID=M1DZW8_SOLTU
MIKCDVISKKTVVVRKEHDVFKNDITMRLQKICGKFSFFNQEANSGPEDTHLGATEEDADEQIIYMSPFLGRLKGGDKKITLPAYERTHSVGERYGHKLANMMPVRYRKAPPLLAFGWVHVRTLIDPPARIQFGYSRGLISTVLGPCPDSAYVTHRGYCGHNILGFLFLSKGPTDSFPNQSSQKGKAAMGDNIKETSLTDVVVANPALADQN